MSGKKAKTLEQIDSQINQYRQKLHTSQGKIINQVSKASPHSLKFSPSPDRIPINNQFSQKTPESNRAFDLTAHSQNDNDSTLTDYIKDMKNLQNALEQKIYILQIDSEKHTLGLQSEINILSQDLQQTKRQLQEQLDTNKMLTKQFKQEDGSQQEKDKKIAKLNEELAHYRKESVKMNEENKKYRADNKIIMNQLDRIQKQNITPEQREKMFNERQIRVMKSLYQDSGNVEFHQKKQKQQQYNELSNLKKANEATAANNDLKSIIRMLNQQISLLKHQKQVLSQQNKQKTIQLQNQKQISSLSQESNTKLNDIIQKMGDKLFNLEEINETLRSSLSKIDGNSSSFSNESYYRTTQVKAGQFYYKR